MFDLVERFGFFKVAIAALLLIVVLFYAGALGWARISGHYWKSEAKEARAEVKTAKQETKVARADEAQATRSAGITAATTTAQDAHATETRAATGQIVERIHERIREVPVVVPVPDDLGVRSGADEARARAQAAADRLQGTPSR